jgi:DNA primase
MDNKAEEISKLINICHSNLESSDTCFSYLRKNRRLSLDLINRYKLGFFPQNVSKIAEYLDDDVLINLNILSSHRTSDFSSYYYLIIPLINEYGETVGISGRSLVDDEQRKYLGLSKYKNSSFKKTNFLFGLNFSRENIIKSNNVYVVEGYFDQIALTQRGIDNCIAICGTSFSQYHFYKLAKYCDKITFILDSDDPGQKSAERIYSKYINKGIKLRFLKVPEPYKDVDEYFANPYKNKSSFFKDFKQIIPEDW